MKTHEQQACDIDTCLGYLGLKSLRANWDGILKNASGKKPSYTRFLSDIITAEYHYKKEQRRLSQLKNARIPEMLLMETFPFHRQPRLKKQLVMELYESMRFLNEHQVLVFMGPTGCGKTGLATAFLIHAINNGYRGRFFDFNELLHFLHKALADHKLIRRLSALDCLCIDEVGYMSLTSQQAGLFFDLMKHRHRKATTIITSQLGFEEWDTFMSDPHLRAALLDRITENCTVFNMTKCISLRRKKLTYATRQNEA